MAKKLEGAGLRGQVAGETSLCTVGQEEGLAYRGHKIELLAEKATFEEVAYLLIYGKLPTQTELDAYKSKLKSLRDLPTEPVTENSGAKFRRLFLMSNFEFSYAYFS